MNLLDYEKEHLAAVREGLPECMVLLKKNSAFPLESAGTLAAYGNGIRHSVKGGTGSGEVNSHFTVGIGQGLTEAGFTLISSDWLDDYDRCRKAAKKAFRKQIRKEARAARENVVLYAMGAVMPEPECDSPLIFGADAAIYVLSRISGEGSDRRPVPGDVLLTRSEIDDILELNERYERFMLILNTGGPVDLSPVSEVGNILVLSQLGAEMGRALADVLLGRAAPSGKLATTWSAWEDYCPDIDIGNSDDTYYREGIYVGYRYFDTVGKSAMFPFGFGLSYTDFDVSGLSVSLEGSKVSVAAQVKNIGGHDGKEVLQVYVTAPEGTLTKPWQDLAGFAKTGLLSPGEQQSVTVTFDMADLASFDGKRCVYCLEAGEYIVRAGTSSAETDPAAVIVLNEEIIVRTVRPLFPGADFEEVHYGRAARAESTEGLPRFELDPACIEPVEVIYDDVAADTCAEGTTESSCASGEPGKEAVPPEISSLTGEELAHLAVGHFSDGFFNAVGNAAPHAAGAAGESTSELEDKGIKPIIMADGPAGLRLSREYFEDEEGVHPIGAGSIPEGMLEVLSAPVRKALTAVTRGKKPPKGARIKTQYCTSLPIGTAIAQTWNTDYAYKLGGIVGSEMERFGIHLWLAPALNIHRSILCGRNFEYFSEDPLISGRMAAALTRGVQSHAGRGATVKHFAANNQEKNRYYNNSHVSERALREIYLRGFDICVREAQPLALMTSYNLINGRHTSDSRPLTQNYLRTECGYKGIVITDWVMHNVKNLGERYGQPRASRTAAAGGDLFMPGGRIDYEHILTALRSGLLTRRQLEINAARVIELSKKVNSGS